MSEQERYHKTLMSEITTPFSDKRVRHVAVSSQKGGVGKTTTAVGIGAFLASYRSDDILALDVNPDGGSMGFRIPTTTDKTILDLRNALRAGYVSPADLGTYINHASHRLNSIIQPPGENPNDPLTGDDYLMISEALQAWWKFTITLSDCGTNLTDPVMDGVLHEANQLVVVASVKPDEAAVSSGGLGGLINSDYGDLVSNAITLIVQKAPLDVDPDPHERREIEKETAIIRDYYGEHTKMVLDIPYDRHISRGKIIRLDQVSPEATRAYQEACRAIVKSLV